MSKTITHFYLLLPLFFILSSCGLSTEQGIEPIKLTNSYFATTASISSTPEPTIALTKTPTLLPTSTVSPSWTPLPTLPTNDADQQFRSWMHGAPDCLFPCWAGITPGKTLWEEAIHLLAPVIDLRTTNELSRCRFGECKTLSWDFQIQNNLFYGEIYSKDDIIYSIYLEGDQATKELNLQNIFDIYGVPEKVFIITSPRGIAGDPPMFFLYVLYPNHNFVIKQIWEAQVNEKNIRACGNPENFSLGIAAIDESQWTNDEIYQTGVQSGAGSTNSDKLQPLEDVTNMSIESFYKKILNNDPSFCIVTPLKYWR
jgi:hypothetical protein